jgi:hypothetical protein
MTDGRAGIGAFVIRDDAVVNAPDNVYVEREGGIELLVRTPTSPGEARHEMDVRPLAFGGIDLTALTSAAGSRGGRTDRNGSADLLV